MSIVDFDNLKVTTMTVIVNLKGDAFIETVFPLLPITKLEIPQSLMDKKKIKIPWPGKEHAGKIFSAKHKLFTRGIIKSDSKKSFRNAVGIEICTSRKNISAKLVKNKIHMCGATSEEIAIETAEHIINHLKSIQNNLDYIEENNHKLETIINWLKTECIGDSYIINQETQEIVTLEEGEYIKDSFVYTKSGIPRYVFRETEFKWENGDTINEHNLMVNKKGEPYYRTLSKREKKDNISGYPYMIIGGNVIIKGGGDRCPQDYKGNKYKKVIKIPLKIVEVVGVKIPQCVVDKTSYPQDIDQRICDFLIQYSQDYPYYNTYIGFLENISQMKNVCSKDIAIDNLNIAMINYSYTLKMNINRKKLSQLIDGYDGENHEWDVKFDARYDNTTDHHVTITLPYTLPEGSESIKRKNKNLCHTFMVYKSGIVTQSGPSPTIMRGAYEKFMQFIESVRHDIKQKGGNSFSIKYRPVSSEEYGRKCVTVN